MAISRIEEKPNTESNKCGMSWTFLFGVVAVGGVPIVSAVVAYFLSEDLAVRLGAPLFASLVSSNILMYGFYGYFKRCKTKQPEVNISFVPSAPKPQESVSEGLGLSDASESSSSSLFTPCNPKRHHLSREFPSENSESTSTNEFGVTRELR